ncbi:MAG: transposase [Hydrococcus sp. RU_2_2]|nr:transposase [Hydrococcus sp. RU_2_2]NJP22048.1 transposase [Hydrococcus sp. CRU_1_1]
MALFLSTKRIARVQSAIAYLETQKNLFSKEGELAPSRCWVARYQIRQPRKAYWYYKLHATFPIFPTTETPTLSKYKHLGKAGSQAHIDGVMSVVRRTIVDELQQTIDSLKNSLLDISFDAEQEDQ